MREFNFVEFHNNIQKDFLDANRVISDLETAEWADMHSTPDERGYDEEKDFNQERLVEIF